MCRRIKSNIHQRVIAKRSFITRADCVTSSLVFLFSPFPFERGRRFVLQTAISLATANPGAFSRTPGIADNHTRFEKIFAIFTDFVGRDDPELITLARFNNNFSSQKPCVPVSLECEASERNVDRTNFPCPCEPITKRYIHREKSRVAVSARCGKRNNARA